MEHRRLAPDRFRRIWALVELVAAQPGLSRTELARKFALSERQLSADLSIVRREIGIPLARDGGYHLAQHHQHGAAPLTLRDACHLAALVQNAWASGAIPPAELSLIADRLPRAFPPQLQRLVSKMLAYPSEASCGPGPATFACLAQALVDQRTVRLHYPRGTRAGHPQQPIVDPAIIMPRGDSWYLIGFCHQRSRVLMFCLDAVESVTVQGGRRPAD